MHNVAVHSFVSVIKSYNSLMGQVTPRTTWTKKKKAQPQRQRDNPMPIPQMSQTLDPSQLREVLFCKTITDPAQHYS